MNSVQPRVVDRTGLTGAYKFTLDFAGSWVVSGAEPSSPQDAATDPVNLPNIFVAIQKQLGLKLVKVKDVPVDMLIVEQRGQDPDRELTQEEYAMPTSEFADTFARLAANHLWQSTAFAAIAALLALA